MRNNRPLISVIMSEYNTDTDLLKNSIKSIINQSYDNFELILIDDNSCNNVENIVKDFSDSRIKLYMNNENMGLVYSLNRALKLSQGKYIVRMDTDDYSYKDRLKKQVDFIEKSNQYSVVGCNCDYYNGKEKWGRTNYEGEVTLKQILNGSPLIHPSIIAKREDLLKVGGYPNYKRCEDYALWIEMFSKGYKMYNMKEILLRYHLDMNDYKKRGYATRKDFYRMLKEQYIKLKPTKFQIIKIIIKTFVASILPNRFMYKYHKIKNRKDIF